MFDGVGGAAVVALIVLLIQRLLKTSPKQAGQIAATLDSQDSSVSNSPVASGSGITQTVNSPNVTVNLGSAAKPALPKLSVEIREVCFDDFLDSLSPDFADFTLERYIFVYVWLEAVS